MARPIGLRRTRRASTIAAATVLTLGLSAVGVAALASTFGAVPSIPTIEDFVRAASNEEPAASLDQSLGDANAIVIAKVASIEDPRWNSADGADWRAEFEKSSDAFTAPSAYTRVSIEVASTIGGTDPMVSPGDTLSVDFVLDPSLDVLDAGAQKALDSAGVAARYLSPGDVRVFVLGWGRYPYKEGWGGYGWKGSVLNGIWGLTEDQLTVYPASALQAQELAASKLVSIVVVDGATTDISMEDLKTLVAEVRG